MAWASSTWPRVRIVPVLPFFNLVMVWNPGISYGLFPASGRMGTWVLIGLSVVAIGVLSWLLWRASSRALAIGYGLIIGGALGNNLVDRVIYGKVADFFHFYGFGYDWYVFNIADLAITLGAVAIIYDVAQARNAVDRAHEVEMKRLNAAMAVDCVRICAGGHAPACATWRDFRKSRPTNSRSPPRRRW